MEVYGVIEIGGVGLRKVLNIVFEFFFYWIFQDVVIFIDFDIGYVFFFMDKILIVDDCYFIILYCKD